MKMKMKMKSVILACIGIISILYFGTISCKKPEQAAVEKPSETAGTQKKAVSVEVMKTKAESFFEWIPATGTIRSWNEADIVSQTSGQIEELSMELGEFKKKDEVLLQVDDG